MKKNKDNIIFKNNFPYSLFNQKLVKKNNLIISRELDHIYKKLNLKKDVFHTLSNKFKLNLRQEDLRKFKKFKKVAIVGMGGSILGTKAIYYFLREKIKKDFLFFDNLDQIKIDKFINKSKLKDILFVVVSKSGNTLETLTILSLIKKKLKNSKNIIIVSEKNNNKLYKISKKFDLLHFEHKKYVGGRYSVLSEVGMLPAFLMGLNTKKIRNNLLVHFKKKKKNYISKSASVIASLYFSKKINNIIFLNYSPSVKHFTFWCQQLIAESLGKKGKGLMPVISTGPRDHHSLLQLYLDGPKDKIFYVISDKYKSHSRVREIVTSQKNAFLQVLKRKKIPYREIVINKFNEEAIGELFSYFIIETAMIGKANNLNPFDQNAVEEVKKITNKMLS